VTLAVDGRKVFAALEPGEVIVWDTVTGKKIDTLPSAGNQHLFRREDQAASKPSARRWELVSRRRFNTGSETSKAEMVETPDAAAGP
jgi:hypothetical protein